MVNCPEYTLFVFLFMTPTTFLFWFVETVKYTVVCHFPCPLFFNCFLFLPCLFFLFIILVLGLPPMLVFLYLDLVSCATSFDNKLFFFFAIKLHKLDTLLRLV